MKARHARSKVAPLKKKLIGKKGMSLKNILVPVDFSNPSDQAVEYSARLARVFGSQLWLCHVIEGSSVATESLQWIDFYNQVRAVVLPMMDNLASRIRKQGIKVKTEVTRGTAYQEIIKMASRNRVNMIVIGTHGRTGVQHIFLGSVAERVVRMAPCPVLTIRP